jgi:hypothetical protein
MTLTVHSPNDFWPSCLLYINLAFLKVVTGNEEGGFSVIAGENIEQMTCKVKRTVIEGQRNITIFDTIRYAFAIVGDVTNTWRDCRKISRVYQETIVSLEQSLMHRQPCLSWRLPPKFTSVSSRTKRLEDLNWRWHRDSALRKLETQQTSWKTRGHKLHPTRRNLRTSPGSRKPVACIHLSPSVVRHKAQPKALLTQALNYL